MSRLLYNRAILNKLSGLIEEYSDIRFGQLLWNCEILYWEDPDLTKIHDPYNDESKQILENMKDSNFCSHHKNN